MDVLERSKIDRAIATVTEECIKQAKHYLNKRKPDIADQYTTLAEHVQKITNSREALYYKAMLTSLNAINNLIGSN